MAGPTHQCPLGLSRSRGVRRPECGEARLFRRCISPNRNPDQELHCPAAREARPPRHPARGGKARRAPPAESVRPPMAVGIGRRLAAEGLCTALLVAVVIGSGIMGERLAGGNAAVALLGNTLATGAALVMLITILGPISGAHFNPAGTLYVALSREFHLRDLPAYVAVQILGGLAGALLAHLMFELPLIQISTH